VLEETHTRDVAKLQKTIDKLERDLKKLMDDNKKDEDALMG
jgi:hypothetical protein